MSQPSRPHDNSLSLVALQRIDEVCDRFEQEWLDGNDRPCLETFLTDVVETERSQLLSHLLRLDVHYRILAGERPTAEEYRLRLSGQGDLIDAVFAAVSPCPGAAAPGRSEGEAPAGDTPGVRPTRSGQPGQPEEPGLPARAGRYRIEGRVAQGGMGEVLRARDLVINRPLAIKVIRKECRGQPGVVRRFQEEAQVTGRLQHPGIPPVHEIGRLEDGSPFFAMKLIEGRTLSEHLAERCDPSRELPRFLTIFEQVCQTLAYAHSQGVLHRDLKPSNVMLGAFGEVQVMDWGLTKVLGPPAIGADVTDEVGGDGAPSLLLDLRTQAGEVVGTLAYIAPEQARAETDQIDERSDVFGLGGILCHILTGQPPYTADPPSHIPHTERDGWIAEELYLLASRGDLSRAWDRLDRCGADAELLRLAKACLAPQPQDRPRNSEVVAGEVAAYLAGVQQRLQAAERERAAAEAREEEARARERAERKARRFLAGLAAAGLLLVLLFGGWVWRYQAEQSERAVRRKVVNEKVGAALQNVETWISRARELTREPDKWREAIREAGAALSQATGLLTGDDADDELRGRVDLARGYLESADTDYSLVAELDEIRLDQAALVLTALDDSKAEAEPRSENERSLRSAPTGGHFAVAESAPRYAQAFRHQGLDLKALGPTEAARRLKLRPLHRHLLGALEDWASVTPRAEEKQLLQEVVDAADDGGARAFRRRWQDAIRVGDTAALERLEAEVEARQLPASTVVSLARRDGGAPGLRLLRAGQRGYPEDFWINQELGKLLIDGDPLHQAEAVRCLAVAVALRPGSPGAQVNLGRALFKTKQSDEAGRCFRKAIEMDKRYVTAHYNLGFSLYHMLKFDEAIPCYQRAIELDPTYAIAYTFLGYSLKAKNRLEEAEWCFRRATELRPTTPLVHNDLGIVLSDQNRLDEAIVCYQKASILEPRGSLPWNNLGAVFIRRSKLDGADREHNLLEAVRHLRHAVYLNTSHPGIRAHLADALRLQGKRDEAIKIYHKAIELDPGNAKNYTLRGDE